MFGDPPPSGGTLPRCWLSPIGVTPLRGVLRPPPAAPLADYDIPPDLTPLRGVLRPPTRVPRVRLLRPRHAYLA